ncbi:hypothetical protein WOB69_23835 [Vibrio parahaemolyticus]
MLVTKKYSIVLSAPLLLLSGCAYNSYTANPSFYEQSPKAEALVEVCAENGRISNELNSYLKEQFGDVKEYLKHDKVLYTHHLNTARDITRNFTSDDLDQNCKSEDILKYSAYMAESISQMKYAASWFTPEAMFGTGVATTSAKWDEITNDYGSRVWVCRNVNNGQFTEFRHCENKLKVDNWPQS